MTLNQVLDIIIKEFSPYSVFLYGSKATNSDNKKSDFEIGVIFEDEKYISRKEISSVINCTDFAIFPFRLSEIMNYDIDTPFQKNIYMNILINGGSETLYGVNVLQELSSPEITVADLLADTNFNLGVALSAVRVFKTGNIELANDLFYKSCFYATRSLIYYDSQKLCLSYEEIYQTAKQLPILNPYMELLDIAHALRNCEDIEVNSNLYYKNISYINKFILKQIQ